VKEGKDTDIVKYIEESIEIVGKMGIKVADIRNQYVKLLLPMKPNLNHIGTIYAGSLFALGEIVGGAIFLASFDYTKFYPVVKELTIRFKRPGTSDMTVEAALTDKEVKEMQKTAEEYGKADWNMSLEIKNESGEVCCLVNGIWQMRKSGA
jgi:thioesterase domain-containing protein